MTTGITHRPHRKFVHCFSQALAWHEVLIANHYAYFCGGVCANWDESRTFYLKNSKEYHSLIIT